MGLESGKDGLSEYDKCANLNYGDGSDVGKAATDQRIRCASHAPRGGTW